MEPVTGLAAIINAISDFVTAAITWLGSFITPIVSNDILLLCCVVVPLVGLGVGLLKRLITVKA